MIGGIHLREAFKPVCPRRPAPNAIADTGRMYDGSDQPSGCGLIDGGCASMAIEIPESIVAAMKVTGNA